MTVPEQPPNLLLIVADQLRGDCIGVERQHPVLTPNIDGLAANGVRFTRAYSTCPICIPARRSLLSGQFPATHGLVGYQAAPWNVEHTLPSVLRDAGYQTMLVGRSMHQVPIRKRFGYDEMVTHDDYSEWLQHVLPIDTEHPANLLGGPLFSRGVMHNDWTAHPWPYPDDTHLTNWTVTQARRFLRRRDPTCPFFLTVSFNAPHPPLMPPAFYFERYLRVELPETTIGEWVPAPPEIPQPAGERVELDGELRRSCLAGYYGSINHIDDQIRRIVHPLHGIDGFDLGNTVIAFTSDHGEMLGDHYLWRKSQPYEGSARVPLIVHDPRRPPDERGFVVDEPVCLEDLMPTLLELAGATIPSTVDGRSLVPLLDREQIEPWRETLHLEHAPTNWSGGFHCLTDGQTKYVWFADDGREQLFDLVNDPLELHDLASDTAQAEQLGTWRMRLVATLAERPEGFVEGGHLVPGRPYAKLMEHARPPKDD